MLLVCGVALPGNAGTCIYMAPEIIRAQPYNEKVDVFSFGIVMFEVRGHWLVGCWVGW